MLKNKLRNLLKTWNTTKNDLRHMGLNHKNVHFFNANTSLCSSADSVFHPGVRPHAFENKQG